MFAVSVVPHFLQIEEQDSIENMGNTETEENTGVSIEGAQVLAY